MLEMMARIDSPDSLDAALVRLAAGEIAVLEQIYRNSAPRLLAVCLKVLGDRSEAEDALHDTFVRLAASARGYRSGQGSAIGWLITIARNLSIDRLRSRASRGISVPVGAAEQVPDTGPAADEGLLSSESAHRIEGCMGTLDEVQQRAIRLAFFNGLTYSQLAETRGVPLGTMKSWIRRGLARLKQCLDQ
jgi:RNA polymerase sigma factor (sigma-70 family)